MSDGDELPPELDVTELRGPFLFPDVRRRRIATVLYVAVAAGAFAGWISSGNAGLLAATIAIVLVALYSWLAAWPLRVDQTEALAVAGRTVGFPIGHASAQLAWRGLRSRPVWRILLYSADEPPSLRGLVECDGVDGTVLGEYTEQNPEDWSQFGLASPRPPSE